MTTLATRKLSPRDHGRLLGVDELALSDFVSGFKYELIEGRLYVSYEPDVAENRVERWLDRKLTRYSEERPDIVDFVTNKSRLFIPMRRGATIPEPDLAAYHDFPLDLPFAEVHWSEVYPILVAEVFAGGDPNKDLIRNVRLYERVQKLREYWILDISGNADQPTLLVHRRRGRKWQRRVEVAFGETYTTKLLPGFELLVDPRRR